MHVIELKNVSKIFYVPKSDDHPSGEVKALDNIDLEINQGEFVSIRGLNGSGKTTALNLIMGLQKPTEGTVKLFGTDITSNPVPGEAKSRLGVMLQKVELPKKLKVKELIRLFQSYYNNLEETTSGEIEVAQRVNEIIKLTDLEKKSNFYAADALSGGWEQRVYIALALSGNPDLLLLDEPTRNLDDSEKNGRPNFWNLLKSLTNRGITILVITHKGGEDERYVDDLASRFIEFHDGKIIKDLNKSQENRELQEPQKNSQVSKPGNTIRILKEQIQVEFLQLIREPIGIVLSLIPSLVPILFISKNNSLAAEAYQVLIASAVFTLLMVSLQMLGVRVTDERDKGWMKLLHITPLPPWIYVAAKMLVASAVSGMLLSLIFIYFASTAKLEFIPKQWLLLFLTLMIGVVPFGALSLSLAYWVGKSTSAIVNGLILIGWFTSGLLPGSEELLPGFLQKLAPYFPLPTYHYGKLALKAGGIPAAHTHPILHFQWLLWATLVFGLLAVFGYRRRLIDQTSKWYEIPRKIYQDLLKITTSAAKRENF